MRQTIISAIATAIGGIDGVKTVTDWYTDQITDSMLPLVNIQDKTESITQEGGINHHELAITVDIYDKRSGSDVRGLATDVMEAILDIDIATDINVEGFDLDREAESNSIFIATLHFMVRYSTDPETMEVTQC